MSWTSLHQMPLLSVLSLLIAVMLLTPTSALAHGAKLKATSQTPIDASETNTRFSGNISWYGVPFHGRKTASGRIYDMNKLTCAHRTLPFGTRVLIENPKNGKSVIVEVIDRGPYVYTRVFDISRAAASELGTLTGGIAFVNCLLIGDAEAIDAPAAECPTK